MAREFLGDSQLGSCEVKRFPYLVSTKIWLCQSNKYAVVYSRPLQAT